MLFPGFCAIFSLSLRCFSAQAQRHTSFVKIVSSICECVCMSEFVCVCHLWQVFVPLCLMWLLFFAPFDQCLRAPTRSFCCVRAQVLSGCLGLRSIISCDLFSLVLIIVFYNFYSHIHRFGRFFVSVCFFF